MKNSFLEDLMLAMENQVPTDETMKDGAAGVGNPDLPEQKAANDPDGNPAAPGDDNATPVGKPDPDQKETELDSQKKSNDCECGNPPAPGDDKGNPNPTAAPAAESMLDGFAMEFFGKRSAEMKNMSPDDAINGFLSSPKYDGRFDTSADAKQKLKEAMAAYNDGYSKTTGMRLEFKVYKGVPCLISVQADGKVIEAQFVVAGAKRFSAFSMPSMRSEAAKVNARMAKADKSTAASESTVGTEAGNFDGFAENVKRHRMFSMVPLQQEKDAKDPSGNTGDPAENQQSPVSKSGDSKIADLDKFVKDSYDASGNTGSPGVNGTPVSKSGDSKELPKNEFEKAADDKDGNPDSPGVNGRPNDPTFDSFITACEQMMIRDREPGRLYIPENMSLESYALELGMGEIAARAMEATLTAAQRRALKDSDFGLPETRQWPLNDEDHVRSAITNFHWCPKEKQRELAKNILKAMRKFGMKEVQVSEGNPFAAYCPDAIVVPRKKAAKSTETN